MNRNFHQWCIPSGAPMKLEKGLNQIAIACSRRLGAENE